MLSKHKIKIKIKIKFKIKAKITIFRISRIQMNIKINSFNNLSNLYNNSVEYILIIFWKEAQTLKR